MHKDLFKSRGDFKSTLAIWSIQYSDYFASSSTLFIIAVFCVIILRYCCHIFSSKPWPTMKKTKHSMDLFFKKNELHKSILEYDWCFIKCFNVLCRSLIIGRPDENSSSIIIKKMSSLNPAT